MIHSYVVDASVALKWFLEEEFTDAALRLQAGASYLHVPQFFLLEVGHVLCKKIRRQEILPDDAVLMLQVIRQIPLQTHDDLALIPKALEIAFARRQGLYDSLYLALAVELDCRMVTADQRFLRSIHESEYAAYALWVEDLPA